MGTGESGVTFWWFTDLQKALIRLNIKFPTGMVFFFFLEGLFFRTQGLVIKLYQYLLTSDFYLLQA